MLENIFTNIKSQSAKMSTSLSIDNLKEHTARLAESIDVLKSRVQLSSSRVGAYLLSQKDIDVEPVRSVESYVHLEDVKDPQMTRWLSPGPVEEDEDNIVDRFIRVITIDDDENTSLLSNNHPPVHHRRRRRNDREEIRRRLAMGSEDADYYTNDQRPGKKPSLQARLQSGMNLQICFMNETLSDTESPGSESEIPSSGLSGHTAAAKAFTPKTEVSSERMPGGSASSKPARPLSLPLRLDANHEWREHSSLMTEADFLARQAQLQTEARMALAQAKDMAHMQMEIERQRQNASPITEMVRHTLQKVGVSFPEDRRRLSRQILTEMNVAQLQVIVNDLHTQIEYLNESLVRFLMERDDLHMEQDSMLVDIEDLTRYLGAKEQSSKAGPNLNNNLIKSNGSSGGGRMNSKK
ncbi:Schwannomin-interacting protein 1 [Frankliniella fusca]|uniref:Schwannomin-interacting protein 1 n=1 Tax=Frankliniella fusca TaxID=407009 RepID=A0AAE1H351_9NEOP|nr:Schwannomin-interacting protein 1 [Frankliniella fusca]